MKDALGNTLKVGDKIVYAAKVTVKTCYKTSCRSSLQTGTIASFSKKDDIAYLPDSKERLRSEHIIKLS